MAFRGHAPAGAMDGEKAEARFLKQARRGTAWWQIQRLVALGLVGTFLAGSAYALWSASLSDAVAEELPRLPAWLALSVASAMWAIHAELMLGAAHHVARPPAP